MALRPPHQALVGPPLPGPPGPPMMLPPMARAPGPPLGSMAALRPPLEEPAAPRELGLGLGLGLKEKEEAVVAAAAGLEEASAAVAVGAGGAPAGPAVIGPSLPLALAMPLPEPEPLPLPLEVVRGLLPPLRIPELLSLRPRPRPPRPEPPPGLMALEVSREYAERGQKGPGKNRSKPMSFHIQEHSPLARGCWEATPHTPHLAADLVLELGGAMTGGITEHKPSNTLPFPL